MTWEGDSGTWAAFGLHPKPGSGMPHAEVFMCSGTFCQARNTLAGYDIPAVETHQYLKLVSVHSTAASTSAIFSRAVAAAPAAALSYSISNSTMGLIFGRGAWRGAPMPQGGSPAKHDDSTIGRAQVNFYSAGPAPGPAPPPPPKRAGVWPDRFDSYMAIAKGQDPVKGVLGVNFFARLRYDFPAGRQIWDYFDLANHSHYIGGELWAGDMLFELGADGSCYGSNMTFGIIRPNWLQGTTYSTTNYLLRQPTAASNPSGLSNYTLADLFKVPNTVGMTNSWLVADSPIAEPIRLEGPNDFVSR